MVRQSSNNKIGKVILMSNKRHQETALAALTVALAVSGPAIAQESPKPSAELVETITVTGSRISRPDLEGSSPISIIDENFLDQKGTVNVEEVLNQLPQVIPGLGAQVNNGGDGTATVDLLGLGTTRTLVLVNGRRFVPATNTGRTDLNAIPAQLIERIELLTGGASAVYGSDALAGVVNFVLKKNFSGVEFGTRFGESLESDAGISDFYGLWGGNFADDKGNATVAATVYERKAVFQDAREWSAIDLQGRGSATGITGRIDNSPLNPFGAFGGNAEGTTYAFNSNNTVRPFDDHLPEANGGVGDRYNFAPINYLMTPQKRYSLNASLNYQLSEHHEAFSELYFISSRAALNLAPTPATGLVLPLNNPWLGADVLALAATRPDPTAPLIFRRRMVEFGPRFNDQDYKTTQAIAGFKGDMVSDWTYEAYYSFGRTSNNPTIRGDLSRTRLNAALGGCPTFPGTPPRPVEAGCRIADFFGTGGLTAADQEFLAISSAVDQFRFDRNLLSASATGSLASLPAGNLGAAFGVEYRKDSSDFVPADSSARGDLTGFNGSKAVSGAFSVKELYGELSLPLLAGKAGAEYWGVGAAARFSDYSSVGNVVSYRFDTEYKPVESLKFRATYSVASRAPSVFELFQAGDQNFPTVTDPCARRRASGTPNYGGTATNPNAPPADIQAICQLQGIAGGSYSAQSNSQVEAANIGNPDLQEEKGTTTTVGLVWAPAFIENFSATLDYYDITVDGYVARAFGGAAGQVNACFGSGVTTLAAYNADPACSLIRRNASGELFLTQPLVNASALATTGMTAALAYGVGLDSWGLSEKAGRLSFRLDMNFLDSYTFDGEEFANQTSSDFGTLPDLRANLRTSWDRGPLQMSVNLQYMSSLPERPGDGGDSIVPAFTYVDLSGRYTLKDRYTLQVGVNNVTDKTPPVIRTGYTNTNTDNTTYDGIGRKFVVAVTVKF